MKQYDYLVVGAGLYGAVFAQKAHAAGKSVLVVDKRPNIAGNVYTEPVEGIQVHKYGAHIFHTNNKAVWDYVRQFAEFNRFTNSPVANYHGELYSLPFNMYTFNKMWGVVTPQEAAEKIQAQRDAAGITEPKNLEEQAISLVGTDIYEKLVKGYTEKQWGRKNVRAKHYHVTFEPLFDDPGTVDLSGINWIVAGTMTGAQSRKIHTEPEWAWSLADQAHKLGIPVFMKEDLVPIIGDENMIQEMPEEFNKVLEVQKSWKK